MKFRTYWIAATAILVGACGGGGSNVASSGGADSLLTAESVLTSATEPSGIYGASITGFTSPSMLYFAMKNQLPFALLGTASADGFRVQSFLLVSQTGATWTPQDEPGWVYNSFEYPAASSASIVGYAVQASHNPRGPSLSGTMTRSSGTWRFSGGPLEFSNYSFNAPMVVSEALGHWALRDLYGNPFVIDIDDKGGVSGSYKACALAGSVAPDAGKKGYLTMSISLVASTCPASVEAPPVPYKGFVMSYALPGGLRQMVLYGLARWEGPAFPGEDSVLAVGTH